MSNVKIFRLTTGEDVIADKVTSADELLHLKNAFVIIPLQKQPGGPVSLQLSPYMPYSNDQIVVMSKDKVITEVEPKIEILNSFKQNLGIGIIQPAKPSLITETKIPTLDK
tara:strand:- start:435 stop:767 length:333 start_codon:yes stop_codon:yes gene_type:complete